MNRSLRLSVLLFALAIGGCAHMQGPSSEGKSQLAPGGKMRAALLVTNRNFVTPPVGETLSGVAVDVAKAVAAKAGVPMEPIRYQSIGDIVRDAGTGKWDLAVMGIEDDRRSLAEFSSPFMLFGNSYLVRTGSSLVTVADVDRKGVRIAVAERSAQHNWLKANLKSATLVLGGNQDAVDALLGGRADALAANRSTVEEVASRTPGYRVVNGDFSSVAIGAAVPKGRMAAAALMEEAVREMVRSGAVAESVDRAKLKGVTVPN